MMGLEVYNSSYTAAIQAALGCQQACEDNAKHLLNEAEVNRFAHCIRLSWECASACDGLARALLRDSEFALEWVTLCASICQACALECSSHSRAEAQRCVEACRVCLEACAWVRQP